MPETKKVLDSKDSTLKNFLGRSLSKKLKGWKAYKFVYRRFFPYIQKNKRELILAQIAGVGYILFGMLEPWPLKLIFDNVFLQKPLSPFLMPALGSFQDDPVLLLNILVAAVILIAFIRGLFYYYQNLLMARVGQQVTAKIRVDLYSHLQGLSFSFHQRRKTGDLLARLTTDIRILRQVLVSLPLTVCSELFLMAGMITVMFLMDWRLSLISLLVIPIIVILLKRNQKPLRKAVRKQREREGHLASMASEVLGAINVVQGFHQEQNEIARFTVENKKDLSSGLRAARIEAKMKWASELAIAFTTAIILGVAARRVLAGALSPGDILVFVSYLKTFNRPIRRISRLTERTARGAASGERIIDIFKIKPTVREEPSAKPAPRLQGQVSYKNVSFQYPKGPRVLLNINFSLNPGERVAFVGPTGCGKSTLVSLLPRFYDPTQGNIFLDGHDIRGFTLSSLRQNISLVFQEPLLFGTTIAENIAYGKPEASLEEIREAARKVKIDKMIESLSEGYDTVLGERGVTISGGQRQCIAIARAIIKDAPIVILDEPTTGLDNRSASLVLRALHALTANKTVIFVTHQLDMIREVDRVFVLKKGQIVQEGKPDELLSSEGLFQKLYYYQSGGVSHEGV